MKKFLSVLVVFALVLASASPACKFISGELAEICGADGSVIQMPVPDELLAYLPNQEQPEEPEHENLGQNCAFCFAQYKYDSNVQAGVSIPFFNFDRVQFANVNADFSFRRSKLYQPRGPPALV